MYPLLRDTYGITGEHAQLLSPTSQRWVGFAKLVTQDLSGANLTAAAAARLAWMQTSTAVGAVIGIILTLLEQNTDRFMRVKSFKITDNLQRPSVHPIDMQISTFMFNTQPPQAPAAPKAQPANAAAKKGPAKAPAKKQS